MTTAVNTADYIGVRQKEKRCSWWGGGCKYIHDEAYNGDRVWACTKCGHIDSVMPLREYEMEIFSACMQFPEAQAAYCNWVPKHPDVKAMWDQKLRYDSRRHHGYGMSAKELAMAGRQAIDIDRRAREIFEEE